MQPLGPFVQQRVDIICDVVKCPLPWSLDSRKNTSLYEPWVNFLVCELDAIISLLKNIAPWECPSYFSTLVLLEINKSLNSSFLNSYA